MDKIILCSRQYIKKVEEEHHFFIHIILFQVHVQPFHIYRINVNHTMCNHIIYPAQMLNPIYLQCHQGWK